MNYLSWTALFSDFLKKRAKNYHNEILLDISENDVVALMKKSQKLNEENTTCNKKRAERGDLPIDLEQYGWQDFRRSLIQNNSINGLDDNMFFDKISIKKREWTDSNNNISVLPYMVLFMLALKEQEVDNDKDFYQRAINYLSNDKQKQILVQKNARNRRDKFGNSFRKVFDAAFWKKYDEYWVDKGYQSNVSVEVQEDDYVGHFQAQCLISSKQRTRFVDIFESARITKDDYLYNESSDGEEIARLMQNYGNILYLGNTVKFNKQFAKYRQRFIKEFIWQYNEWDGVYRSVELVGDDEEKIERIDGFSAPLLLFSKNNQLCFVTKYEDRFKILRGHYSLEGDRERKIEFVDYKTPISFDGIADYVNSRQKCVFTHENEDGKKYRLIFMPRNIYYFVQLGYSSNYTTTAGLQIGRKYRVVKRHEDEDWNYSQAATIQHNCFSGFDEQWEHYIIDSLPSIEAERQIIVSLKEQQNIIVDNKVFFKFPIRIKIDNINTSKNGDKAYVVFDNHFESPFDLVFDETEFIWKLNDNEHRLWKYVGQKFKVYVYNGQEGGRIPYQNVICDEYELSKFELPNAQSYRQSMRNQFGLFDSSGQYSGLSFPNQNCSYQPTNSREEKTGKGLANQGAYLEKDYLLYLLNECIYCDKRKFISLYQTVYENNWKDDFLINYDRLGFVNYDYLDGQHLITLNTPRFILLSSSYRVDNSAISNHYSQKDYYEMLLTGGRSLTLINKLKTAAPSCGCVLVFGQGNEPYPQKITVRAKKAINLVNLARKVRIELDYDCNKGILKYGESLIRQLPTLKEFENTMKEVTDIRTTYLFRTPQNLMHKDKPLFVCLDYSSCRKKESYSMELDLVTYGEYANKKSYLLYNNDIFEVDKYWGNIFVMSHSNPRIRSMRFDDTNSTLRINQFIKIPAIYSRVLTLMTGELPTIEGNDEVYYIPDRSFVVTPNANNPRLRGTPGILEKLGQD